MNAAVISSNIEAKLKALISDLRAGGFLIDNAKVLGFNEQEVKEEAWFFQLLKELLYGAVKDANNQVMLQKQGDLCLEVPSWVENADKEITDKIENDGGAVNKTCLFQYPNVEETDVIVIGFGPAAIAAVKKLKSNNMPLKIVLIRKNHVGKVARLAGYAKVFMTKFLITSRGKLKENLPAIIEDNRVMEEIYLKELKNLGVKIKAAEAQIEKYDEQGKFWIVNAGEEYFRASKVIVASGTITCRNVSAAILPEDINKGIARGALEKRSSRIVTQLGLVALLNDLVNSNKPLPKRIVITGGGVIAIEYACILARQGIKVIVLDRFKETLARIDPDLAKVIIADLLKLGVVFYNNVEIKKVEKGVKNITLTLTNTKGNTVIFTERKNKRTIKRELREEKEVKANYLLVAAGVEPDYSAFKKLIADNIVKVGDKKAITNINELEDLGLILAGSVKGSAVINLVHNVQMHSEEVISKMLGEKINQKVFEKKMNVSTIFFREKEFSSAETAQDAVIIAEKAAFKENGNNCFVKIKVEKETGRVVGVYIASKHSSEIIAGAALFIYSGGTVERLLAMGLGEKASSRNYPVIGALLSAAKKLGNNTLVARISGISVKNSESFKKENGKAQTQDISVIFEGFKEKMVDKTCSLKSSALARAQIERAVDLELIIYLNKNQKIIKVEFKNLDKEFSESAVIIGKMLVSMPVELDVLAARIDFAPHPTLMMEAVQKLIKKFSQEEKNVISINDEKRLAGGKQE